MKRGDTVTKHFKTARQYATKEATVLEVGRTGLIGVAGLGTQAHKVYERFDPTPDAKGRMGHSTNDGVETWYTTETEAELEPAHYSRDPETGYLNAHT